MNTVLIVKIVSIVAACFLAVQVYSLISILFVKDGSAAILSKRVIQSALDNSHSSYFSADKLEADMSKYGLMYMLRDYNIEASSYIAIKLLFATALGIAGIALGGTAAMKLGLFVALAVAGFFAPDIFIRISNNSDNENMSSDILQVYSTLKIHAKAGVYITDSLIECQRIVENKRLKQAFKELNNNILSAKLSPIEAITNFNARFSNSQIDNLVIILIQSFSTGRSSAMLEDLSKQIQTGNALRLEKKESKLKKEVAILQVIFFGVITMLLLYLIASEMAAALTM